MATQRICTVSGCRKPQQARSYCGAHLYHLYKYGDAHREPSRKTAAAQMFFFETIKNPPPAGSCVIWTFALHQGVGRIHHAGKVRTVHRYALELTKGEAPEKGMYACHNCNNGHLGCFNPHCLEWKTPKQNSIDCAKAGTMNRKLTPAIVRMLREIDHSEVPKYASLLNVRESTINSVRYRRSWAWVD